MMREQTLCSLLCNDTEGFSMVRVRTGESIRSLILKEGLLTEQELDEILDPIQMTEPGISGKELLLKKS